MSLQVVCLGVASAMKLGGDMEDGLDRKKVAIPPSKTVNVCAGGRLSISCTTGKLTILKTLITRPANDQTTCLTKGNSKPKACTNPTMSVKAHQLNQIDCNKKPKCVLSAPFDNQIKMAGDCAKSDLLMVVDYNCS